MRADGERPEDPDRHVALRIARLLRGRRHGVEPDEGEEDHRRAAQDARSTRTRRTCRCSAARTGASCRAATNADAAGDDDGDDADLERDHHGVHGRRLPDRPPPAAPSPARVISTAGRLNTAVTASRRRRATSVPGAALSAAGNGMPELCEEARRSGPTSSRRRWRRRSAYSRTRSQPMIQATSSPSVA